MSLNAFDWTIIIVYLIGMIGLSFFLARGQKTGRDYYLGGNETGPLPIALSTMATQCSTNSLLGAPAFVAFAAGGGMICSWTPPGCRFSAACAAVSATISTTP